MSLLLLSGCVVLLTGFIGWGIRRHGRILDALRASEAGHRLISERMKQERDFVHELINALPGAFYLIAPDGRFRLWNQQLEHLTGLTHEEMSHATPGDFFQGQERTHIQERVAQVFEEGNATAEASIVSKTGTATPHYFVGHRIELSGQPHLVGMGLNISERRAMEQALRESRDAAESASLAKSLFLANVSHELRTPMNTIIGMGYLLNQGELSPEQRLRIGQIRLAADTLLGIIRDILDYSKIESGKMELERRPFRLEEVLERVMGPVTTKAREKGLHLQWMTPATLPRFLIGDALRLEQILLNLGSNAIKFTEHGTIQVQIQELSRTDAQIQLQFTVADSGIGMSAEQIAVLFKPFVQADPSTTRSHGGTGLGLALCKSLVEMMAGTLQVTSQPGAGSTFAFTLTFPWSHEANDALTPPRHQAPHHELPPGARILVVEDHELNWQVLKAILKRHGLEVERAVHGQQAIERLVGNTDGVDCVLMDLQMPVMDGYEATRQLRRHFPKERLPIIALTANALISEKERCLELGMNDYLTKPVHVPRLLAVLSRYLAAPTPETQTRNQPEENGR
ncbi:MAG: response regulator [Magnetococcales bacterium]|nr:response regulator [Magnetococcales bacterium]